MRKRRLLNLLPALALAGLAACGDAEDEGTTTREIVTEQGTKEVEVTVPTVDTAVIERTVDVDTSVSVERIENPAVEGTDP